VAVSQGGRKQRPFRGGEGKYTGEADTGGKSGTEGDDRGRGYKNRKSENVYSQRRGSVGLTANGEEKVSLTPCGSP